MPAPVTYIPNFIASGQDFLMDLSWRLLPWEQRDGAPRRECWFNPYGLDYTYGSGEYARTYKSHDLRGEGPAWLVNVILQQLNASTGASYDCCFVNGYEHGRQHLGWHADDSPEMDDNHPIATVSLGAEREIWFRQTPTSQNANILSTEKLLLANGSAAIMHAGMQRSWQHRIPKSPVAECGPRISFTCRKLVI